MSSLVATVDTVRSWVRLDLDVSDVAPIPVVTITRTRLDTGDTATVRPYGALSGGLIQPVAGRIVMFDVECPNDVQVQYTATYNSAATLVRLNANQGAENGILSPWVVTAGGALAASQLQAQAGFWAFQFTPDGVTANPAWSSEEVPAVAGKSYTVTGQLWSTSAATWSVGIRFFDATHAVLSTSTFNVALVAGTWTSYSNAASAPANTAFARIFVQASGTPAGANILYGDVLTISTTINVSVSSTIVTDPSNGFGWLIDPTRPALNVRLDMTRRPSLTASAPLSALAGFVGPPGSGTAYLGLSQKTRRGMGGALDMNNTALPTAIARARRAPNFELSVMARSFADRDAVNTLLASGAAVLLQVPAIYGEPDRYLWTADTVEGPIGADQRRQFRAAKLSVTQVAPPVGPMQGTLGERFSDLGNHYPTLGALAAGATGIYDAFGRTLGAGSWGSPDVGPGSYVLSAAAEDSVGAGLGVMSVNARNVVRTAVVASGSFADVADAYLTVIPSVIATGASYQLGMVLRYTNASNYYIFYIDFGLTGTATPTVAKLVAGVLTTVKAGATFTYAAGAAYRLHASIVGTTLSLATWAIATGTEPGTPNCAPTTDASLAGPGQAGAYAFVANTNTNTLPVVGSFDDLLIVQGPSWQAIMDGAAA